MSKSMLVMTIKTHIWNNQINNLIKEQVNNISVKYWNKMKIY